MNRFKKNEKILNAIDFYITYGHIYGVVGVCRKFNVNYCTFNRVRKILNLDKIEIQTTPENKLLANQLESEWSKKLRLGQ